MSIYYYDGMQLPTVSKHPVRIPVTEQRQVFRQARHESRGTGLKKALLWIGGLSITGLAATFFIDLIIRIGTF